MTSHKLIIKAGLASVCVKSWRYLNTVSLTRVDRLHKTLLNQSNAFIYIWGNSPQYCVVTTRTKLCDENKSESEKIVHFLKETGQNFNEQEVKNKLNLLAKYRCQYSEDKLDDFLEVLKLDMAEIKCRGETLLSMQVSCIQPNLFLLTDNQSYHVVLKNLELTTGVKGRDNLIKNLLQCTTETEWNALLPYLGQRKKAIQVYLKLYGKIEFLISQGFTPDVIKSNPALLSQKSVKERLLWVQKTIPFVKKRKQIEVLTYTSSNFLQFKKKCEIRLDFFKGCKTVDDVLDKISKLDSYLEGEHDNLKIDELLKLQAKINYIKQCGYKEKQIAENIDCLLPSIVMISKHVECHRDVFTVDIMEDRSRFTMGINKNKALLTVERKFGLLHADMESLQTRALAKNVKINYVTMGHLLKSGYSLADIAQHIEVLGKRVATIHSRTKILKKLQNKEARESQDLPALHLFLINYKTFYDRWKGMKKYSDALASAQSKESAITTLLCLNKSEEKILDYLMNEKLSDLKERVTYLKDQGIPNKDIVNEFFCLHIPLSSLKFAVGKLKNSNKKKLTLSRIIELAGGPPVHNSHRTVNIGSLVKKKLAMKNGWEKVDNEQFTISVTEMNQNFKLLINKHFSVEDLMTCPYILGHSHRILQEAVNKLNTSEELLKYPDIATDKVKLLSFLQYSIEHEHGFRPVVNDQVLDIDQTDAYRLLSDTPHVHDVMTK